MRVWTIKEGEPLPLAGCHGRIMRCGIISRMLAERGHDVTWWSSTYSHQIKERVRPEACTEAVSANYKIKLIHAKTTYKKNISLARIRYHKQLAAQFTEEASKLDPPDIIYSSYPTIDFAYAAVRYGEEHNIPVVVDVRDFWPDIFIQPFPKAMHSFIRLVFKSYGKKAKYAITNATAVVGVVPFVFDWTLKKGREKNVLDHTVFLAYDNLSIDASNIKACDYCREIGLNPDDNIICFFGNITERVDFLTVINAAKILKEKGIDCKFVICGTGAYLPKLKQKAAKLNNIIFPGFIDQDKIAALMEISTAGILPYFNREDFIEAVPNKAIEYLAGGLPVLSSLQGHLKTILSENRCGIVHTTADELARNIELLLDNKDVIIQMKNNAKDLYTRNFTADKVYGDFCDFLELLKK